MTLSLLAILMLPIAFKMVLDPQGTRRVLKQWSDSEGMQFFSSIVIMMLALLILSTSEVNFLNDGWAVTLSWLAVVTGIKGVVTLIPSVNKWKMKLLTEERLPIAGFASMLFALALVYIDTQVI